MSCSLAEALATVGTAIRRVFALYGAVPPVPVDAILWAWAMVRRFGTKPVAMRDLVACPETALLVYQTSDAVFKVRRILHRLADLGWAERLPGRTRDVRWRFTDEGRRQLERLEEAA